jgi:hypothetical protein
LKIKPLQKLKENRKRKIEELILKKKLLLKLFEEEKAFSIFLKTRIFISFQSFELSMINLDSVTVRNVFIAWMYDTHTRILDST